MRYSISCTCPLQVDTVYRCFQASVRTSDRTQTFYITTTSNMNAQQVYM